MQISCICNFDIFVRIFTKFSPKCRTKKLGMIYTILGRFCSFLNWERADIRPQIRPRKILDFNSHISEDIDKVSCTKSLWLTWVTWVKVFTIIPEFRISIKSQP